MSRIAGALWNCGGLRVPATSTNLKADFIEKEVDRLNLSLVVLVETHLKQTDTLHPLFQQLSSRFQIINEPTPPSETHAGILILVHNELNILKTQILQQGRIVCIEIMRCVTKEKYKIIAVYGQQNQKLTTTKFRTLCSNLNIEFDVEENNVLLNAY